MKFNYLSFLVGVVAGSVFWSAMACSFQLAESEVSRQATLYDQAYQQARSRLEREAVMEQAVRDALRDHRKAAESSEIR